MFIMQGGGGSDTIANNGLEFLRSPREQRFNGAANYYDEIFPNLYSAHPLVSCLRLCTATRDPFIFHNAVSMEPILRTFDSTAGEK